MKKVGLFGFALIVTLLFASFGYSGGSVDDFLDHCPFDDNDPLIDCYIAECPLSSPGQVSDIQFLTGTVPQCQNNYYCDSFNRIAFYIESDDMADGDPGRETCHPSGAPCCGNFTEFCDFYIEDCSLNGDFCIDPVGLAEPYCCSADITCTDYAQNTSAPQCGVNLHRGCGQYDLDCSVAVGANSYCDIPNEELLCDAGYGDCDFDMTNGCEIDTMNDPLNCGGCNIDCGGFGCVNGMCLGPEPNKWTDLLGNPVSQVELGDFVRMESNYDDPDSTYLIQTGDTVVESAFPQTLYQPSILADDFRFQVNDVVNDFSGDLMVIPSSGDDDPFEIEVIGPECSEYYDLGEMFSIIIQMNDANDFVFGELTIGSTVIPFDNSESSVFQYDYTTFETSNLQIVVEAENSRGDEFKMTSNIMVYDSSDPSDQFYVSACIDSPGNFEQFESADVAFDASSTKGLIVTTSGGLTITEVPPQDLYYEWTFLYSNGQEFVCPWGLGSEACPGDLPPANRYTFVKVFPTVNDNYVTLNVGMQI